MKKAKIQLSSDQRPFVMVYYDFLETTILDNYYQKLIFIYLKRYANSQNQCFPSLNTLAKHTGISKNKVKSTLKELEAKKVIKISQRKRKDGSYTSNLYVINDFAELWKTNGPDEVDMVIDDYETQQLVELLESKGYTITKDDMSVNEKELASAPTKVTETSTCNNLFDITKDTSKSVESQCLERFSMAQIKEYYEYDILIHDEPMHQKYIDSVMTILHNALNTTKNSIRVCGEDKPTMVVQSKLMKLSHMGISYAIDQYTSQTGEINHPMQYMLTLLYLAEEQQHLEIANKVKHDMSNFNPNSI